MESPCCTEPAHQTVVSPFLKLPLHHIRKKVLSWPFFPLTEKTAQIIAYWEIQPQSCWIPCSWNRPVQQMPRTRNSHDHGHGMTSPPPLGRAWDCPRAQDAQSGGEGVLRQRTVKSKGVTEIDSPKLGWHKSRQNEQQRLGEVGEKCIQWEWKPKPSHGHPPCWLIITGFMFCWEVSP